MLEGECNRPESLLFYPLSGSPGVEWAQGFGSDFFPVPLRQAGPHQQVKKNWILIVKVQAETYKKNEPGKAVFKVPYCLDSRAARNLDLCARLVECSPVGH